MTTSEKLLALFAKGWTQAAISKETNIPQGTISRMAAGNDPRESNALLIDRLYERELSTSQAAA